MSVYEGMDFFPDSLLPWLDYRKNGYDRLKIALVHNCFKENFENGEPLLSQDGTIEYLKGLKDIDQIDFFEVLEKPSSEHEARNIPLNYLLNQNVDYIISSAPDEYFSKLEINNIFNAVAKNPYITVFSINYKNLVFTENTYLNGFCPKRIWKTENDTKSDLLPDGRRARYLTKEEKLDYLQKLGYNL